MQRANVNVRSDDKLSEDRHSFAELLTPPPARGTKEYDQANPSPCEALQ